VIQEVQLGWKLTDGQGVLGQTRNFCMNFTAKHTDSDKLEDAGLYGTWFGHEKYTCGLLVQGRA
jgi:hypothetical protein